MSEPSRNNPSSIQRALAKKKKASINRAQTKHAARASTHPLLQSRYNDNHAHTCSSKGNSTVQRFTPMTVRLTKKRQLSNNLPNPSFTGAYKVAANPPIGSFRISMAKLSEQLALCQPGGGSEMTKDNNDRGSTVQHRFGTNVSKSQ